MFTFRTVLLASAFIVFNDCPTLAQGSEPDQKSIFVAYVNSQGYKDYLERAFNLAESPISKSKCEALRIVESIKTLPIEQPVFIKVNGNFSIEKGAWIALATLDRCGTKVIRRVLLKAISGKNSLAPTFLLPGEFRGNLQLEVDAIRIVTPALAVAAKCQDLKQLKVVDIKSLTPPAKDGWSETWTADACGKLVDCAVSYGATGNGMDITAGKCSLH